MLSRLAEQGMPQSLREAGFVGVGDFWEPWCVAFDGGEIASMAFAARIGVFGAGIGVYTFPGFRGRGLGASVTASWSSLPSLRGRDLFYSALTTNTSSRRVTDRLGLARIGASVRIN
jgi:predicted GNAT family acetyltransferase